MAIRRNRIRRRLLTALVVVSIAGVVVFSVLNVVSLKKEQKDMREQQEALEKEKAQLEQELKEINDPENLEAQAREQLKLIKKGEKIYIFPEEIVDAGEEAANEAEEKGKK